MDDESRRRAQREEAGRRERVQTWLLAVIALVLIGSALHVTAVVVVPVVCSAFIALLVAPVDEAVARKMPEKLKWAGHVAAMVVLLLVLLGFFGSISLAAQRIVSHFPGVSGQIQSVLMPEAGNEAAGPPDAAGSRQDPEAGSAQGSEDGGASASPLGSGSGHLGGGLLAQLGEALTGARGTLGNRLRTYASGVATGILGSVSTTLGSMVLIFFLTLLILIEAPGWRRKVSNLAGRSDDEDWFEAIGVIAARLRRYLLARTVLGLITAALYVGWLWIFDVDLLIVWGLIAFLLNFIPTLGSLVAGALPVLFAFAQKDPGTAVLVAAGIFVIEQVMGNFVDPRVQGRQVAVSPLVVLVVLVLWGWIWGIPGTILAVPLTITAIIVLAHIPALRPVALLLSNESDMDGLDRIARNKEPV